MAIVKALLAREPARRLGCGPTGAGEVMGHPFFAGLDWDDVRRKRATPPSTLADEEGPTRFEASGTPPLDDEAVEALLSAPDAGTSFAGHLGWGCFADSALEVSEETQREFDWFSDIH